MLQTAIADSVRELDSGAFARWDAFVMAHPEATFFHRAGWKRVVERSFGHRAYFLYAERAGRIVGVLPLVHMKSLLFGSALVSTSFCVVGGPVAEDAAARGALEAHMAALADRLNVSHVEYRSRNVTRPDWKTKSDLYFNFRKAIVADPEQNLKAIPRKQRAVVRHSLDNGLVAALDDGADRVHAVYAESVRNLGTPVFGKSYFRNLKAEFGKDCEALVILKDNRPVSAVLSFYFRDEVLPYYGGGTFAARALGSNDFMYWDLMRRAGIEGRRIFDFGRSKLGTGSFSFKKNWGFTAEVLNYEYWMRKGGDVPEVNPLNPKYRIFIETWKRLPVPVANLIGPFVVRNIG